MASELKDKYKDIIVKELMDELNITNIMAVPQIEKITVNAGIGKEYVGNSSVTAEFSADIEAITSQKPIVIKSKKAVSNFKLRIGMDSGIKVTLRGEKMWDFLDKLVNTALPRVKDFRGLPKKLDKNGNYSIRIKEHTIFPEIDTSKMVKIRPMQVTINTTTNDDKYAIVLLEKLGVPFKK